MKFLKSVFLCSLIVALLITPCTLIFAHESILDVSYDECAPPTNIVADGEDEIWYFLEKYDEYDYEYHNYHIDDDILEIKYYFAETEDPDSAADSDSMYTWTTDIEAYFLSQGMSYYDAIEQAEIIAEEIKIAYASSMEKWNNIYYYTYDESGNRTANKIITVTEGTENDHNLIIYPMDYVTAGDTVANTSPDGLGDDIPNDIASLRHTHYTNYKMNVNVNLFFQHNSFVTEKYTVDSVSANEANICRERNGQHELGHVLGLRDVDICCNVLGETEHHEEVLMGYGNSGRIRYATYKDIAGVSITRGFHTDEDHIWMMRTRANGMKDVICALCNAVRYNVDTTLDEDGNCLYDGKKPNIYQSCVHHERTNQEMLLVATDGTREFFKCLYCRHIDEVVILDKKSANQYQGFTLSETFSTQEEKYLKISILSSATYKLTMSPQHKLKVELYDSNLSNTGLIEDGTFVINELNLELSKGVYYLKVKNNYYTDVIVNIALVNPPHTHNFDTWVAMSPTMHIKNCGECGAIGTETGAHAVRATTARFAPCLLCGYMVDLDNSIAQVPIMNVDKVTINGSYILPNGIIVLVDEDIEAYLNGTLVFYKKDDLPVTQ